MDPEALTVFQHPPDQSDDVREYKQRLRLTFDNAADFSWGKNWVHLLSHPDDLRKKRLDRMGFALGNAREGVKELVEPRPGLAGR